MKKSSRIILSVVIVLLLAIIGAGGYLLIFKLNKTNNKINELENKISASQVNEVRNATEQLSTATKNETNNTSNNTVENSTITTTDTSKNNNNTGTENFNMSDLKVDGITFGSAGEEVLSTFGSDCTSKSYEEGASGNTITELNYEKLGLLVNLRTIQEDGVVDSIYILNNSKLKTARGIGISSTVDDILKAYKSDSILKTITIHNIQK